jgi:MarR family transcriptional regulator, transcriptional regulator for hemolysin
MDDIVARPLPTAEQVAQRFEFAVKLGELARLWRGQIDRHLRPLGLSFMQWQTLTQLARADEDLVQKELAAVVGMEGPTMVGVLDRLVERDLVERHVAAHDRRANTVHLTDAGSEILRLAEVELHMLRDVLLADLSGEELDICVRVFGHVSAEARAFDPDIAEAAES